MKFLIKATYLSGKHYGKHYYIRPGGYQTDSCNTNEADHCYYKTRETAEAIKRSYEKWNQWYLENCADVSDKKAYQVCRVE